MKEWAIEYAEHTRDLAEAEQALNVNSKNRKRLVLTMDDKRAIINTLHAILHGRGVKRAYAEHALKLDARLKTFTIAEIVQSAYHLSQSPFHMGDNDRNKVYGTVEFLLRSDVQIEKWLETEEPIQRTEDMIF